MRRRLAALIAWLLVCAGAPAMGAEQSRVALVIGNSRYASIGTLDNPGNDARLTAATLKGLGFTVIGGAALLDLEKPAMERAVREFHDRIGPGSIAFFYYSGHGLQIKGENFLVPVKASLRSEADAAFELVSAELVLRQMEHARASLNIVVLDACRNNPFAGRGMRAVRAGLAEIAAVPDGTVISFATAPGGLASDGETGARNSPYTLALNDALRRPGLDVLQVFNQVGVEVKRVTGGAQRPWISASPIEGSFLLAGAAALPAARPVPPAAPEAPKAGLPAVDLRCPPAGTIAVRSGGARIVYEGSEPGALTRCIFTVDGDRRTGALAFWAPGSAAADRFVDALRKALHGSPGQQESFVDTTRNGSFAYTVLFQGREPVEVGGTSRPALRFLVRERGQGGNGFAGDRQLWFDEATGVVLRYSYIHLAGRRPNLPSWSVIELRTP